MTTEAVCCRSETELVEARVVLKKRCIRHLPVVNDEGQLEGMISIGDLNAWELDGQERTSHYLSEYLYGGS